MAFTNDLLDLIGQRVGFSYVMHIKDYSWQEFANDRQVMRGRERRGT